MKGVFVYQQLEIRIEAPGDEFSQGETVPCTLTVKNHRPESQEVPALRLDLALADLKKVKARDEDAYTVVATGDCGSTRVLAPQETMSISWTFQLDTNCPISDRNSSLFLLYGPAGTTLGALPVTVRPNRVFPQVISLLESSFQFVCKNVKAGNGAVEAKLKPPTARRFSLVEELTLGLSFDADDLLLKYRFRVKRFETSAAAVGVKKGKTEVEQRLSPAEFLISPGHIDHPRLETRMEEAFSSVVTIL